jgi:flagellar assembly protein FliH
MSSNCIEFDKVAPSPVKTMVYLDMASRPEFFDDAGGLKSQVLEEGEKRPHADVELSDEDFAKRIHTERVEATQEAEQRVRSEYEQKLKREQALITEAVCQFEVQQDQYFAHAEAEIVQLALAIAGKILHREAQVDPMLVAALVRMAIDKMREGSSVIIRLGTREVVRWREYFAARSGSVRVQIVEDAGLTDHDCFVETELGTANFGLDTQLKEVERGFFDLMALRPVKG